MISGTSYCLASDLCAPTLYGPYEELQRSHCDSTVPSVMPRGSAITFLFSLTLLARTQCYQHLTLRLIFVFDRVAQGTSYNHSFSYRHPYIIMLGKIGYELIASLATAFRDGFFILLAHPCRIGCYVIMQVGDALARLLS